VARRDEVAPDHPVLTGPGRAAFDGELAVVSEPTADRRSPGQGQGHGLNTRQKAHPVEKLGEELSGARTAIPRADGVRAHQQHVLHIKPHVH
jgi:hypothetical protein